MSQGPENSDSAPTVTRPHRDLKMRAAARRKGTEEVTGVMTRPCVPRLRLSWGHKGAEENCSCLTPSSQLEDSTLTRSPLFLGSGWLMPFPRSYSCCFFSLPSLGDLELELVLPMSLRAVSSRLSLWLSSITHCCESQRLQRVLPRPLYVALHKAARRGVCHPKRIVTKTCIEKETEGSVITPLIMLSNISVTVNVVPHPVGPLMTPFLSMPEVQAR